MISAFDLFRSQSGPDRLKTRRQFFFFSTVITLLLIGITAAAASCCRDAHSEESPRPEVRIDQDQQDTALLLAGLPVSADSRYASLAKEPAWQQHRAIMNSFWAGLEYENLQFIAAWQAKEIPEPARKNGVLYPLSGADFLNAYSFFPEASDYVMIAMEPPGRPPVLDRQTLPHALKTVSTGLWWFAKKNYFTSTGMRISMKSQYAEGVLPLFMVFLTRLGHSIVQIQAVEVAPGGKLVETGYEKQAGLRIIFRDGRDGRTKQLVYLKTMLKEDASDPNTPLGAYLNSLSRRSMMLKSAIYLFHMKKFEALSTFLISKSDLVLEDDSGIPYHYFRESGQWDSRFYGRFVVPLPLAEIPHPPHQPDLAGAFRTEARPLPFSYGYGILRGKGLSNVTVMTRKQLQADKH